MKSFPIHGKEKYFSPETEIIPISIEMPVLNTGNSEPIGGGDDPDVPWPDDNN